MSVVFDKDKSTYKAHSKKPKTILHEQNHNKL